jgi:hypothetical protein
MKENWLRNTLLPGLYLLKPLQAVSCHEEHGLHEADNQLSARKKAGP